MSRFNIYRVVNYLKNNWIPIILISLSIYDLRIDLRLLLDSFTFSSLLYTISEHPLAIAVLITIPTFLGNLKKSTQ